MSKKHTHTVWRGKLEYGCPRCIELAKARVSRQTLPAAPEGDVRRLAEDVMRLQAAGIRKDDEHVAVTLARALLAAPAVPLSDWLPPVKKWNELTGRDGRMYADGWNACLESVIEAAPAPVAE